MCSVQIPKMNGNKQPSWKDRVVAASANSNKLENNRVQSYKPSKDTQLVMKQHKRSNKTSKIANIRQHPLHSTWTLYYHNPMSNKWDDSSYKKVSTFSTIQTFCALYKMLDFQCNFQGMFFLMRNKIKPVWEDEHNKSGGCWSFKVSLEHFYKVWKQLSILLVGELLCTTPLLINGISVSPKRGFCIVKIWNHDAKQNNTSLLRLKNVMYLEDNGPALFTAFESKK